MDRYPRSPGDGGLVVIGSGQSEGEMGIRSPHIGQIGI